MNVHRAAFASTAIAVGVDYAIQRRSKRRYDVKRTLRVASYAWWSSFPQMQYFKWLGNTFRGNTFPTVVQKTMVNQCCFAPINISLAIIWDCVLLNKTSKYVYKKIQKNLGPALIEGSVFWIPMNSIGFYMIPNDSQFIFFKFASVMYKFILLSRINS
jgi:hypothetical protein